MNDPQKKTDLQKGLFDEILKKMPPRYALVDVVSELLEISSDAAYRRIRGDKVMDIFETTILCDRFGISFDALFLTTTANTNPAYSYTPLDLGDTDNYGIYMESLSARLERLRSSPGAEIISSALDVPLFHFLPYKDLTFFKLFAWTSSIRGSVGHYEEFVKKIESPSLLDCYNRIVASHRLIPSKEIWTNSTTDTFLRLLNFHFEMGHFADTAKPLSLCEQFLDLLNNLENWTEKGDKGDNGCVPLQLYLSDVDMENSFILLKEHDKLSCILKLFTINSLYITDEGFCSETYGWLGHLSRRATLISGASEKERYKFFNHQRQKVRFIMDMISNRLDAGGR